jgi:pimeloyl-ACP methyl ester carboxylesterase/phosphohistidine phosphatase SixA
VADPNMRYVPKAALQQWASQHGSLKAAGFGEADAAAFVQLRRRIVRAFAQAGVPMMAGSDTAQNFHIWGPGLHDEVRALAAAGLTPMQALRAATVTPRDYFRSLPNGGSALGWKADFGTVKPGARADLILLSGDPSRNLDALTRPTLVIAAGRVYERSALDAMLGNVIADANATPAPSAAANAPPKQVYVMRHLPAGEGVDPDLTNAGAKLAQALPDFLKAGEFKAVFATPYKRTQQTAAPVAAAFGVPVGTYDPRDPDGLLRAIASVPGNVLVIGHSNTVPDLIGRLGGKPPAPVGETDFGTIFRVDSGSKLTKVFELGGIPPVALGPCKVQGLHPSVRCGTIAVAENRADPKSRTIDIHFGVQPAAAVAVDDPIVMLPGGPGLGGLQSGPGTDQMFGSIMKDRDLLMIDQRGTGHSNPLQCPQVEDDEDPLGQLNESTPTEVTTCRDALLKKADLRFYHTREAVKDMEIVRAALGYQKLDLFGMSYGTRPALDYLRLYPNRVGETVIRAAAPSEMKLPLYSARDIQTSFDRMVEACMEQAPCAARHPDLKGDLQSLLTTLEKAPARISIKDPRNGKTLNGKLSRDGLGTVMFAMLYIPEFYSQLPALIGRAKEGNFSPLVQAASPFLIGVGDQVAWGMRWSVVCDEDVRRIGAKEIPAATRNTFIGDKTVQDEIRACAQWPRAMVPAEYLKPVKSDKPVFIISGRHDPIAGKPWGDLIARTLPNSLHIEVPGASHLPPLPGCTQELIGKFYSGMPVDQLDTGCVAKAPKPKMAV